jgi:signal transduction histidine kinase
MIRRSIRNIIVGKDNYITCPDDYKHVLLSGILILTSIPAIIPFAIIDFSFGYEDTLRIYLIAIECMLFCLLLHRNGYHVHAKNLVLISLNFTVYAFAASDPVGTGTRGFFAPIILVGFIIFSRKELKWIGIQVLITLYFYTLSYLQKLPILSYRPYTDNVILLNDMTSVVVVVTGCTIILMVFKYLNYAHEGMLEQRNDQLLQANLELDRFVYSTSHDLRAPLTSLMGLIHLTTLTKDASEIRHYLSLMKDRISTLDKFIHDITSYSRNKRQEILFEKIYLADFINDIWQDLKHADEAQKITLQLDFEPFNFIIADRHRLRIILSNLLSNAIRYHDSRKEHKYISIQYITNGSACYLKVQDNGLGIAKDHQAKIFDMFFRAHERSDGSGLGLYIVKEAVQKMSGHIHLESTPGVGSCFTIRIPKHDLAAK